MKKRKINYKNEGKCSKVKKEDRKKERIKKRMKKERKKRCKKRLEKLCGTECLRIDATH